MRPNTLLAYRAGERMTDLYRGQEAFIRALYQFHKERAHELELPFDTYIAQKVALKGRQFNTILNNPELEEERKALEKKNLPATGLSVLVDQCSTSQRRTHTPKRWD